MAALSPEEVLARIESPRNSADINAAILQEERLLFHGESIMEKFNLPFWANRNFTNWWQTFVSREKYNKIENLITTPIVSVSLVEDLFKQIGKFRDAQDRYVSFDFTNVDYTNDYQEYLDKMCDDYFWRENALEALKTGINDMVVIDLPAKQNTERPEPYQYLVSPSMFMDLEINKFNGKVEYFIFRQSVIKWDDALGNTSVAARLGNARVQGITYSTGTELQKCICIDDNFYRVLFRENKLNAKWQIYSETPHGLGYCPVIDFWKPSISGSNGINKKGIITNLLSKLDMYVFYSALVSWNDIYAAFPIFNTYSMDEEEWDSKSKQVQFGDSYNPNTSSVLQGDNAITQDPRTAYIGMGAGAVIENERPKDSNDFNPVKDSPNYITVPAETMKYVEEKLKKIKSEIQEYATGECLEYMNEIAKNESMMNASFNKQDSILTFVKRQVERVHTFATRTKAELRYGKEFIKSVTIDYGRDFILKDANSIVEEYSEAKEAGMHPDYCNELANQAILTRFKNNPDKLARNRIIKDIIPYHDLSAEDIELLGINQADVLNFIIRINSSNFVSRFELEYGDIVRFGETISYSEKIFKIKSKLQEYGRQLKQDWTITSPSKPNASSSDVKGSKGSKGSKGGKQKA